MTDGNLRFNPSTAEGQQQFQQEGVEVLAPAAYLADSAEDAAILAEKEHRSGQVVDSRALSSIWED